MRTATSLACVLLVSVLLLAPGCGQEAEEAPDNRDYVTVDHILIGVNVDPRIGAKGDEPEEAKKIAYEMLQKLKAGKDWAPLKGMFSDDPPPGGPYTMANHNMPKRNDKDIPRERMATAFGDVSFSLKVGEIGIADYDPETSPFGYHIIKRIK